MRTWSKDYIFPWQSAGDFHSIIWAGFCKTAQISGLYIYELICMALVSLRKQRFCSYFVVIGEQKRWMRPIWFRIVLIMFWFNMSIRKLVGENAALYVYRWHVDVWFVCFYISVVAKVNQTSLKVWKLILVRANHLILFNRYMQYKKNILSFKHLVFMIFVSCSRSHWYSCNVVDYDALHVPTQLF